MNNCGGDHWKRWPNRVHLGMNDGGPVVKVVRLLQVLHLVFVSWGEGFGDGEVWWGTG